MKLAIMQPYFFPYIGYFQLINAADKFVIYDDVNFIKQGWVNRNALYGKSAPVRITIPLINASSNRLINEIEIDYRKAWAKKLIRTVEQTYSKAPYFNQVFPMVKQVLENNQLLISDLAKQSIVLSSEYLGFKTEFITTSSIYNNKHLSGVDRVLDICAKENATDYINSIGGRALYDKDTFSNHNLDLSFLASCAKPYKQYSQVFQPSLSIIDIMMFNSKEEIAEMLSQFRLE
jgi:hypothetical protein